MRLQLGGVVGDRARLAPVGRRATTSIRCTPRTLRCARAGVTVDVVPPAPTSTRYRLVVVPSLYLRHDADAAASIARLVAAGGHGARHVLQRHRRRGRPRAHSAATPARSATCSASRPRSSSRCSPDETVPSTDGARATLWTRAHPLDDGRDRRVLRRRPASPASPRVTRNTLRRRATAWYLATALEPTSPARRLVRAATRRGRRASEAGARRRRDRAPRGEPRSYLFVINHDGQHSIRRCRPRAGHRRRSRGRDRHRAPCAVIEIRRQHCRTTAMTTTSASDQRPAARPAPTPRRKARHAHSARSPSSSRRSASLFALFYLVPIGYAIYQSLLVVERERHLRQGRRRCSAVSRSTRWSSRTRRSGRRSGGCCCSASCRCRSCSGLALLFALLLDSPLVRGKKFFRLAFFVPYAVPGVIAAIMWGYLYSPNLSPFTALTANVDFLGADLVLWSIANVVTWVYVGYNMLIIYSALLAIPPEIYEAARLDGASQCADRLVASRSRWWCRRSCSPRCSRSSARCSCSPSRRCSAASARR